MAYTFMWSEGGNQFPFDSNGYMVMGTSHTNGSFCVSSGGLATVDNDNTHNLDVSCPNVTWETFLVSDGAGGMTGMVRFKGTPGARVYLHTWSLECTP